MYISMQRTPVALDRTKIGGFGCRNGWLRHLSV